MIQEGEESRGSGLLCTSNLPEGENAATDASYQANRQSDTDCQNASGNVSRIATQNAD